MIQRACGASFHARYVLAHLAGAHAGHKEGRAGRDWLAWSRQVKDVGRTVPDTQTTPHACTQKITLRTSARWTQGLGRKCFRLGNRQSQSQSQHADATPHASGVEHECPSLGIFGLVGVVHTSNEKWTGAISTSESCSFRDLSDFYNLAGALLEVSLF